MKKEEDRRLIIPRDAFEEEASEGLGRLNREEAAEDMRDLEGRMSARTGAYGEKAATRLSDPDRRRAKRLRKNLRIWIPAAAAVIIILIASTIYVGLFRDRQPALPETAMVEESKKDTVLIAMASPITKAEVKAEAGEKVEAKAKVKVENEGVRYVTAVVAEEEAVAEAAMADITGKAKTDVGAGVGDEARAGMIIEILEPKELAEEVIVQAVPAGAKAAQGIPARAEVKAEVEAKASTETRAAKDVPVAGRQTENISAAPDHAPRAVEGIEVLNSWIISNIRYPQDGLPRTARQVIVSFKVRADSTVYDLNAEQTPGDNFTNEAFRLLREGPKWEPAIRNGIFSAEPVRVRITFKKP